MTRKVYTPEELAAARRVQSMRRFAHRLEADLLRPPPGYTPNIRAPSDPAFACKVLEAYVSGLENKNG
ncbi:hypothetical protein K0U83_22850 [bacterium]|nr:hypothetical protein [bacterium]